MFILQSIIYSSAAILPNRLLYALAPVTFQPECVSFVLSVQIPGRNLHISARSMIPSGGKAHKDYCPTDEHLMKFQDQEAPAYSLSWPSRRLNYETTFLRLEKGNLKYFGLLSYPGLFLPRTTTRPADPAQGIP